MKYLFLLLFLSLGFFCESRAEVPKHKYTQRQAARVSRRIESHHARERVKTHNWLQRQHAR